MDKVLLNSSKYSNKTENNFSAQFFEPETQETQEIKQSQANQETKVNRKIFIKSNLKYDFIVVD